MCFDKSESLQLSLVRVASVMRSVLDSEPLLDETRLRISSAIEVSARLAEDVQRHPCDSRVQGRVRRFLLDGEPIDPRIGGKRWTCCQPSWEQRSVRLGRKRG